MAAQKQIAEMLGQFEGVFFRIDDLSAAQMEWVTFVNGIDIATRKVPGSMTDSRIRGVLVGDDEMVALASESMKQRQYGATDTPMFTTQDKALSYARQETAV